MGSPPCARPRHGVAGGRWSLVIILAAITLFGAIPAGLGTARADPPGLEVAPHDAAWSVSALPPEVAPTAPSPAGAGPSWSNVTAIEGPSARTDAAAAFDPLLNGLLLFGGRSSNGAALGDTWVSVGGVWSLLPADNGQASPGARWGASMSYDSGSGYLLLFGGRNATSFLSDSWIFNATGWHALATSAGPSARAFAASAYDPGFDGIVVFGGLTGGTSTLPSNQTWVFGSGRWSDLTDRLRLSPPARAWAAGAYDPSDGYLLLFGGAAGLPPSQPLPGTWALTGSGWSNVSSPSSVSPDARVGASLALDPQSGALVLFGGAGASVSNALSFSDATWSYRAGDWSNLSAALPVAPRAVRGPSLA